MSSKESFFKIANSALTGAAKFAKKLDAKKAGIPLQDADLLHLKSYLESLPTSDLRAATENLYVISQEYPSKTGAVFTELAGLLEAFYSRRQKK